MKISDICQCFNRAFSDYPFHFELTVDQLTSKIQQEGIDLGISVGAFKDSILIAFVIHAKKTVAGEKISYNAGTGVIPEERGQTLTRRMYDFITPRLIELNFSKIILEVLSGNMPAISSYEKIGFGFTRNFHCYGGNLQVAKSANTEVAIRTSHSIDFNLIDTFRDTKPSWQNSDQSILNAGDRIEYIVASVEEKIVGYCVYDSVKKRILQLGVARENRKKGVARSILSYVQDTYSPSCTMINIEEDCKTLHPFLKKMGLKATIYQHEMEYKLS